MAEAKYKFKNIIGEFYFDSNMNPVKKPKSAQNLVEPKGKELFKILAYFKAHKYFKDFYSKNIDITKKKIRESVNEDNLVIQSANHLDEMNKIINTLAKRLREWYELYNPEFSRSIQSHEKFAEIIMKKSKDQLLKELGLKKANTMGADFSKADLKPMFELAELILIVFESKKQKERYLESVMKKYCPNMVALTGGLIGAKLLAIAGSLRRMVMFPASTIQLLGAEKALFRHMRTGSRVPKYGVIHDHPLIQKVAKKDKGKAARTLADKISIAVKVDYFKGEFIGDKLKKQVEARFL